MGYAIAEELAQTGARVLLISGPVSIQPKHPNIRLIKVTTAQEMYGTCIKHFTKCDGAILAAAVADYTPVESQDQKIKRTDTNLSLPLKATKDIALALGKQKKKTQFLVGFALETSDEVENAKKKLVSKNLDFIVLNSLKEKGAGFHVDTNKITIIDQNNKVVNFELKTKTKVATDIVNEIIARIECLSG